MDKYFGTDGIRGVANAELDAVLACRAGFAAAVAVAAATPGKRPLAVVGRDTRLSCDMLEAAFASGLCSGGADAVLLGVVPTPAVAYITRKRGADMGIVISASHNTYEHNGIKIFNADGFKLADALEAEIERLIDDKVELKSHAKPKDGVGRIRRDDRSGENAYIDRLVALANGPFHGIRAVVDCANGAASRTARVVFARLNIDATVLFDEPDGVNINDGCGSTHMEELRRTVLEGGYDIGIAFDGDADRCLIIDENGDDVDGDAILAVCALDMKQRGVLRGNKVVGTVMTNSGFREFAHREGIELLTSDVGDRNVLELMHKSGANLGGETSGHTIFLDDATSGDGELTAVRFLSVMRRTGKSAAELARDFPRYPQIMLNVAVKNEDKKRFMDSPELTAAIADEEASLGGAGRVLVRPSGTEPLIRVTVEAESDDRARSIAERIAGQIGNN